MLPVQPTTTPPPTAAVVRAWQGTYFYTPRADAASPAAPTYRVTLAHPHSARGATFTSAGWKPGDAIQCDTALRENQVEFRFHAFAAGASSPERPTYRRGDLLFTLDRIPAKAGWRYRLRPDRLRQGPTEAVTLKREDPNGQAEKSREDTPDHRSMRPEDFAAQEPAASRRQ